MTIPDVNKRTDLKVTAGKLLIAEPFLSDGNFVRAVVLVCEHSEEGTVGFIMNKATELTLGDLLPELYTPQLPVYNGGPVQLDTLHMLHRMPAEFGGNEIAPGVYWGGSYDSLKDAISNDVYKPIDMKLFVGYAGWSAGQLEKEVKEGSWLVSEFNPKLLFEIQSDITWKESIRSLGKDYEHLAYLPLNPQYN